MADLGDASYSIYIFQIFILPAVAFAMRWAGLNRFLPFDIMVLCLALCSVSAGYAGWSPQFPLALALKDVRLALEVADADRFAALACLADEWQHAVEDGLGDDDVTVITRMLDQQAIDAHD